MEVTLKSQILTHGAVLKMLGAAATEAEATGQPQCIVIVDASGEMLGTLRMNGAKFLSLKSARAKARTSASIAAPSGNVPEAMQPLLATATQGEVTGLNGGMPIFVGGDLVGAIGIGSGSPQQDIQVAEAAIAAIGANTSPS